MSRYRLTDRDREIMEAAADIEQGGMATFTGHYFSPMRGKPRWDLVWKNTAAAKAQGPFSDTWDDRISPSDWDLDQEAGEYVPWLPLSWQMQIAHDSRSESTIVGGFGSGKTVGLGAVLVYWCCMMPGFRAMDVAPVGWQAKQMYDAIRQELANYDNRDTQPTYISRMVVKMIERPYPKVVFYNGSTIEFMSADENGRKILSWNGDVAVIDEAGKLEVTAGTDLGELVMNLGSRLRGVSGSRERMGKLIVASNADYAPALWERFDYGKEEALPDEYLSIRVRTADNPYVTDKQLADFKRRIKDPEKRRQYMDAERPLPRGNEFTPLLIERCQSEALDDMMSSALESEVPGYELVELPKAGVVRWVTPASNFNRYVLIGDPGQNVPPSRNSPVCMVFDVTGFPQVPAKLAAFEWVNGRGSYWPFINKFAEWFHTYHPLYSAWDATGVQKGFDELAFVQHGVIAEGMNVQSQKMKMVVALKLIMGKGMLLMPRRVQGIWMQLAGWHHPDTKLRQDIASTLFMTADVLNRFYVGEIDDGDKPPGADASNPANKRPARRRRVRAARKGHERPSR